VESVSDHAASKKKITTRDDAFDTKAATDPKAAKIISTIRYGTLLSCAFLERLAAP
jgi:hypothetical protein